MATLAEIRARYPQYDDLSDAELADGLYRKFYSDMPRADFNKRIGLVADPLKTAAGKVKQANTSTDAARADDGAPQDGGSFTDDLLWGAGKIGSMIANPAAAGAAAAAGPPGRIGAALQGATLGTADEIAGGFGGVMDWLGLGPQGSEGTFSGGYDRTAGKARKQLDDYRQAYPVESAVAEGAGILATLPFAGPANLIRVPAALTKAAPLASRIGNWVSRGAAETANSAITGGLYGAGYGAGTAEGGLENRIKGAIQGAMTGGTIGAVAPAAVGAVTGAGKVMGAALGHPALAARSAFTPETEAARRVVRAAESDAELHGSSLAAQQRMLETGRRAGVPITPLDIGETTRALGRSAANTSPAGRDILNRMVDARFESQGERAVDLLSRVAPGINAPQTRLMLEQAAARATKPAYARAYREGARPIWSPELERLASAPAVVDAMRAAVTKGKDRAIVEGFGGFNPGVTVTPDGRVVFNKGPTGVPTYPDLQFWDYVKRELDQAANVADRTGRMDDARVLRDFARTMRTELDRLVPSFANARSTAAAFFGADDALSAGETFVRSRADNAAARDALAKMTPAERQLFAEGFASKLVADIRELGDRRNLVIQQMFKSPAARERIEIALGPQTAREMEAFLLAEDVMDLGRMAVQGNSTTARQLAELGIAGGIGAGAGLWASGGDLTNPATLIVAALTGAGIRKGRGALSSIDVRVAREVADLLASQDPQRFREAVNRIGRNPSMLLNLRKWHERLTRALIPQATRADIGLAPGMADSGGPEPAQAGGN